MKKLSSLLAVALCLCLLFPVLVGCQKNVMTVSFDSNGGSAVASQSVKRGKYAVAPEEPAKFGYVFDGWETADGTEWAFDKQAVKENVTLIAKWRESGVSLSVRNVSDPFEDVIKPHEEQILAFFNYEFITTHFSTFVNTLDPEANEVYKHLDGLQIKEDLKEFKTQLDEVLGTPSAVEKNRNVSSRFRFDYKEAKDRIRTDLASGDPAVVAAAQARQDEMLEQIRQLNPEQELPLPSEAAVAKLLFDVYKDLSNIHAALEPMIRPYNPNLSIIPLQIDAGEVSAEETVREGASHVAFEYEGSLIPSVTYNPGESSAPNAQTADDPKNWYTVVNRDASEDPGENEYVPLSSFSGYVIRKSFTLSPPETTTAYILAVYARITGKGGVNVNRAKVLVTPEADEFLQFTLSNNSSERRVCINFKNESSGTYLRLPADETLTVNLYVYVDGTDSEDYEKDLELLEHVSVEVFFVGAGF